MADPDEARREYGVTLCLGDGTIMPVAHNEYTQMDIKKLLSKAIQGGSAIDVKAQIDRLKVEAEGFSVWRL